MSAAIGHPERCAPGKINPSMNEYLTALRGLPALSVALLGGILTTLTIAPFGWWPLGFPGLALLFITLIETSLRSRFIRVLFWGLGLYVPSLFWMTVFSLPGGIFVGVLEAVITAVTLTALVRSQTPTSTQWSFIGALMIADALRSLWPLGGLPLGGIDLGQAGGPVANVITLSGRLGLVGVVALGGCAIGRAALSAPKQWKHPAVLGLATIGIVITCTLGFTVNDSGSTRTSSTGESFTIAMIQGGGPRGERATVENADRTWKAHLAASRQIDRKVDFIVWPENTVDAPSFAGSAKAAALADIARDQQAWLSAGITEDAGPTSFTNAQILLDPQGEFVDRFDKVRRVPYGEYFPLRSFIEGWGLAKLPARDATPGHGPGVLHLGQVTAAVLISYEGFFDDRSRGGVEAGGEFIIIPTNSSSYKNDQLPRQQVAAAQLRALETRRSVLQVGPTGISGEIDPNGHIRSASRLGRRSVITTTIRLRHAMTPYVRFNDAPALALAALALVAGWLAGRPLVRQTLVRQTKAAKPEAAARFGR
jgi:apolipoprotein N-acyltransferase